MKIDRKSFEKDVVALVSSIPVGRVMTYGQIAALVGFPRAAQMVGWVMHWSDQKKVPYQRVVNRFGGLAVGYTNGGIDGHKNDLLNEGIVVGEDGTIDLERYMWWPKNVDL
ncbi:MAG: MGMT family protein [Patescibacteria group bacterium]